MDRRQTARDQVTYDGVAEIGKSGAAKGCVVHNISEKGARIEFEDTVGFSREPISLTIARKGQSLLAKIIWWRDNFIGVAFSEAPAALPASDLDERLRQSEVKKQQLQRRIDELLNKR
jgi:hypothetical protein